MLLGRTGRYGAEALAASLLALRSLHSRARYPPPEHAGPVTWGGPRRRSKTG